MVTGSSTFRSTGPSHAVSSVTGPKVSPFGKSGDGTVISTTSIGALQQNRWSFSVVPIVPSARPCSLSLAGDGRLTLRVDVQSLQSSHLPEQPTAGDGWMIAHRRRPGNLFSPGGATDERHREESRARSRLRLHHGREPSGILLSSR